MGDRLELDAAAIEGVAMFRHSLSRGFVNVSEGLKAALGRAGAVHVEFKSSLAEPIATDDEG